MKTKTNNQQRTFHSTDDLSVKIIQILHRAKGDFVSGEDLAAATGISRVAVWKRLQKLQEEGFTCESVRRKGYRILQYPEGISSLAILSQMPSHLKLTGIWYADQVRSTNSEALENLAKGAGTPFIFVTKRQTMGRGRLGRTWYSTSTGNLYMSVGFQPFCSPRKIELLSLWCGIRLCRCLREVTGLPLKVKWPNDLWIGDKKVAGILSEATFEADRINGLVLGVGLNINTARKDFSREIRNQATSLRLSAKNELFSFNQIAAYVGQEIIASYEDCLNGLDEDALADLWSEYACFLKKKVQIICPSGEVQVGRFVGIDRSGSLLLRTPLGKLLSFRSGDVSLRPKL